MRDLRLKLLPQPVAVCRLSPRAEVPAWVAEAAFGSVTRTPDELSIVCDEPVVPADVAARRGYRALEVAGPLCFDAVGILARLARPLAAAGIPILAISTHDTDYLLVADAHLSQALRALRAVGHRVAGEETPPREPDPM